MLSGSHTSHTDTHTRAKIKHILLCQTHFACPGSYSGSMLAPISRGREQRTVTEAKVKNQTLESGTKDRQHPFGVCLGNEAVTGLLMSMCRCQKRRLVPCCIQRRTSLGEKK